MPEPYLNSLALLPLSLYHVPAGLRIALAQEGIGVQDVDLARPNPRTRTRFVLYDSDNPTSRRARSLAGADQIPIDVDACRHGVAFDPFLAMIDHSSRRRAWRCGALQLQERAARFDKGQVRSRIAATLRDAITARGGVWLRIARFPYPYRSAFNFRVDLDECDVADYQGFARARGPIAHCTTHFVSTAAYGDVGAVMRDLARHDSQSHGHYHHVYRDRATIARNLSRAHHRLARAGIEAVGYAAPGGRWNVELDAVLEELGYEYSSDFQLHFDDWPAYPWLGTRFSRVMQVPIHPVCEGLFLEAGCHDGRVIADYLVGVVRAKVDAGEPAFVYGHPERRLGKHPEIVTALARAVEGDARVWQTTLTQFARWWARRAEVQFRAMRDGSGFLHVHFETEPRGARLAIEVDAGDRAAVIPMEGLTMAINEGRLDYRIKKLRFDGESAIMPPRLDPRAWAREALDWETVTPPSELPAHTVRTRWKKRLRLWKSRRSPKA